MTRIYPPLVMEIRHAAQPEPAAMEPDANEFAGRFLVPHEILVSEYDQACKNLASAEVGWREIEGAREFIAKKIAPRFGVNHQVIETRFDHEGIWPVG